MTLGHITFIFHFILHFTIHVFIAPMNPFTDLFTPLMLVTMLAALQTNSFTSSNLMGWPSWFSKQPLSQYGSPSLSKLYQHCPLHIWMYMCLLQSSLFIVTLTKQTNMFNNNSPITSQQSCNTWCNVSCIMSHAPHYEPTSIHCELN